MASDIIIDVSSQGYDIDVTLDATFLVQPGGGGNSVLYSGTPQANEIPVFVSQNTVVGNANLVYDGSYLVTPQIKTVNLQVDHIAERNSAHGIIVDNTMSSDDIKNKGTFVSGFSGSGYNLKYTGGYASLELDFLTVRRKMWAYELEIREVNSIGGTLVISVANGVAKNVVGNTIYFDVDGGANPIQFVTDDIVRAQAYTGRSIAYFQGRVTAVSSDNITVQPDGGSDSPWNGMKLVQVGHVSNAARQNLIYLTASDSNNPYIDMLAGVTDGSFAGKQKLRIGNLTGITDADFGGALSGYGLYSNNIYLKGQIIMTGGSVAWTAVSGKPSYFSTPTGSGLFLDATHMGYYSASAWKTYMDSSGNFVLGDYGGGNAGIGWNQGTGTLTIRGTIAMTAGSVDWSLVGGKPSYLGTPVSTPGLYITSTYLGYFDGSGFTSYIDSSGNCVFTGVSLFGSDPGAGGAVTIEENTLTERTVNGLSYLVFNNAGYNGGTTKYRGFIVNDGRGEGPGHNLLYILPSAGAQSITMGDIGVTESTLLFEVFGSQKVYNDLTVYDNLIVSGYTEIGEYLQVSDGIKVGGSGGPDSSTILDLISTTKALLVPRMTTTQRNAISSPVNGMIIYDTTAHQFSGRVNGAWSYFTMH